MNRYKDYMEQVTLAGQQEEKLLEAVLAAEQLLSEEERCRLNALLEQLS